MKKYYCFGNEDFCDRDCMKDCADCEHFDRSGGEEREVEEVESAMTCKDCIHDAVCGCRSHEDEVCSHFKNCKQSENTVEVVRCEDCVYRLKDDVGRGFCELGDFYVGETDYCSRGKRREE